MREIIGLNQFKSTLPVFDQRFTVFFFPMITFIEGLPRQGKQIVAMIADFTVLGFAMWAGLAIRLENMWPDIKGHSLLNLCTGQIHNNKEVRRRSPRYRD